MKPETKKFVVAVPSGDGSPAGMFKPRKRRTNITEDVRQRLEVIYANQPRPSPVELGHMAEALDMDRDVGIDSVSS